MSAERPVGDERDCLGGNAVSPVGRTEPVTDLGASPIDIGHRLESHTAHGTTINDDGERERWVDRGNATDISLGIGEMVRMGEEVA